MTEAELKREKAAFKAFFATKQAFSGVLRVRVVEIKGALRFVAEISGSIHSLWKHARRGTGYVRID